MFIQNFVTFTSCQKLDYGQRDLCLACAGWPQQQERTLGATGASDAHFSPHHRCGEAGDGLLLALDSAGEVGTQIPQPREMLVH